MVQIGYCLKFIDSILFTNILSRTSAVQTITNTFTFNTLQTSILEQFKQKRKIPFTTSIVFIQTRLIFA